ncbi:MAG TPA: DUF6113 family protein [Trebonia sp.]
MGTSQGPRPDGRQRALMAAGYLMLFVLGILEGLIGSFQYAQPPAPLIAIVLALVIFATCAACGWGIGTFAAGLMPALGWIVASFIVAMPRPNGSVVITATAAGEWYLYGGALACLVGSLTAFVTRLRRPAQPR